MSFQALPSEEKHWRSRWAVQAADRLIVAREGAS